VSGPGPEEAEDGFPPPGIEAVDDMPLPEVLADLWCKIVDFLQ
jgi:hypothetical protein